MVTRLKTLFAMFGVICLSAFSIVGFSHGETQASAFVSGVNMDVTIKYSNRELTHDGVLRESSYAEKMIRRKGHVWTQRVLPGRANEKTGQRSHEHKEFNHVVLARHVSYDGGRISVEFVDTHERQVIFIAPAEYENVNFDGSWENTYFLINPQYVAAMPLSSRPSAEAHAQWHELNTKGVFQRVLWDKKFQIPLVIETGDEAGSFLQRVEVKRSVQLEKNIPWKNLQGYARKEYSDFLD